MVTFVSMSFKRLQPYFIHLDTIDSTNNYAAKLLRTEKVENGTTILTKRQTSGKGQRGASWQSDIDDNLLMSCIVFPEIPATDVFLLNVMTSLAVCRTLRQMSIIAEIKWPNDVLVNGRKICGILIENQLQGTQIQSSVIGIGLNVNQRNFQPEFNATSIVNEKEEMDTVAVGRKLLQSLDFYFDRLLNGEREKILDEYYDLMFLLNQESTYRRGDEIFKGTIKGIDEAGKLLVETGNRIHAYDLREISFVR